MALDDARAAVPVESEAQRSAELDRLLHDFQREFGSVSREGLIYLARAIERYADAVADFRAAQQGYGPVY
jgi:hypothetical protein